MEGLNANSAQSELFEPSGAGELVLFLVMLCDAPERANPAASVWRGNGPASGGVSELGRRCFNAKIAILKQPGLKSRGGRTCARSEALAWDMEASSTSSASAALS